MAYWVFRAVVIAAMLNACQRDAGAPESIQKQTFGSQRDAGAPGFNSQRQSTPVVAEQATSRVAIHVIHSRAATPPNQPFGFASQYNNKIEEPSSLAS